MQHNCDHFQNDNNHHFHHSDVDQVYKDLAFCENPLEREQEVEDIKVDKIQSLQQV